VGMTPSTGKGDLNHKLREKKKKQEGKNNNTNPGHSKEKKKGKQKEGGDKGRQSIKPAKVCCRGKKGTHGNAKEKGKKPFVGK